MNAEAEGGALSSQIKTDEHTAWTCLPKILRDQVLRFAHLSATSSAFAAACSSLRPCRPPARTPTPRCLDARHGAQGVGGPLTAQGWPGGQRQDCAGVCMCVYVCVYVCERECVCMQCNVCTHTHINTHTYTHTHIHIHTHTHACIHTYMHAYIPAYIHT